MKLERISNSLINECFYTGVHESGLKVILIPKKDSPVTYAVIGAKCGSIDSVFKVEGEKDFTRVPDGIAHFLEHKMFECEDGDAFLKYSKTGASANAFTSFDKTCYLFSCTHGFYESLDILLDFVQRPYFTKETVDKEQGIIGQEIKMYEDNPGWVMYYALLEALYCENPIKTSIAGTVESISEITAELLHYCYNAFYNPANMTVAVCGDFDVDRTAEFISERVKPATPRRVISQEFTEPEKVKDPFVSKKMPVSMPLVALGYKDTVPADPYEKEKRAIAADIITEALFGHTSGFYCEHYDKGDINAEFDCEYTHGRGYALTVFEAESRDPEKLVSIIKAHIENAVKTGIQKEDFDIAKRKLYGNEILSFDSTEHLGDAAVACDFAGIDIFTGINILKEITLEDVNDVLKTLFNESSSAVSVIYPLEEN